MPDLRTAFLPVPGPLQLCQAPDGRRYLDVWDAQMPDIWMLECLWKGQLEKCCPFCGGYILILVGVTSESSSGNFPILKLWPSPESHIFILWSRVWVSQ